MTCIFIDKFTTLIVNKTCETLMQNKFEKKKKMNKIRKMQKLHKIKKIKNMKMKYDSQQKTNETLNINVLFCNSLKLKNSNTFQQFNDVELLNNFVLNFVL